MFFTIGKGKRKYISLLFNYSYFCLIEKGTERRETGRNSQLMVQSANTHKSKGWLRLKAVAWNAVLTPTCVAGTQFFEPSSPLPEDALKGNCNQQQIQRSNPGIRTWGDSTGPLKC